MSILSYLFFYNALKNQNDYKCSKNDYKFSKNDYKRKEYDYKRRKSDYKRIEKRLLTFRKL